MIKSSDISIRIKMAAATGAGLAWLIGAIAWGFSYHDKFITSAEAAEQKKTHDAQIILLRVENKETEKRTLIRERKKALRNGETAEAASIEADIQTLRDQIKGLCDQIDEC